MQTPAPSRLHLNSFSSPMSFCWAFAVFEYRAVHMQHLDSQIMSLRARNRRTLSLRGRLHTLLKSSELFKPAPRPSFGSKPLTCSRFSPSARRWMGRADSAVRVRVRVRARSWWWIGVDENGPSQSPHEGRPCPCRHGDSQVLASPNANPYAAPWKLKRKRGVTPLNASVHLKGKLCFA
jgi:hypothetical protein